MREEVGGTEIRLERGAEVCGTKDTWGSHRAGHEEKEIQVNIHKLDTNNKRHQSQEIQWLDDAHVLDGSPYPSPSLQGCWGHSATLLQA